MRKLIFACLAFICLLAPQMSNAQSWSKLSGTLNNDNRADGLLAMPDGGVVTSVTSLSGPYGGSDFLVTRYDVNGDMMWSRFHGTTGNDNFGILHLDNAGNIILGGYTNQPTADGSLVVMQLNPADGTENWEIMPYQQFSSIGMYARSISQDEAGNYIIAGTRFNAAQLQTGGLVISINPSGTAVNWFRELTDLNFATLVRTGPNRFVISGGSNSANVCAYKMSISGGLPTFSNGRKYFISPNDIYSLGYFVEELDNGDLVFLCGTRSVLDPDRNMAIIRADSNGVAQAAYEVSTNQRDGGFFSLKTPQNTIMIYGSQGNNGTQQKGLWVEVNPYTGAIIAEGFLDAPEDEIIYGIRRNFDNTAWYVSGVTNSSNFAGETNTNFNHFLAKVSNIETELMCPATVTTTTFTVTSSAISTISTLTPLIYADAFNNQVATPLSQQVCLGCGGGPSVTLNNGGGFCYGASVTLTANAQGNNLTYAWSHDGTLIPNQNGSTLELTNLGNGDGGTYSVIVTNAIGCTAEAQTTVTVFNSPEINISGGGIYCDGISHTIFADLSGYVIIDYIWEHDGVPMNINSPTLTFNPLTVADGGDYFLTVVDANGCSSSSQVNLVVEASPEITFTGGGAHCAGFAHTLTASSPGFIVQYEWSFDGNFLPNETGASISFPNFSQANAGTYSVTMTNANGCVSSAQVTLSVSPDPVVFINGGGTYCYGSQVTLSVQGGLASYAWSYNGDLIANETSETLILQALTNATAGTYTVTVTNNNGCTGTAQTTLSYIDNPEINIIGGGTACVGGVHTLTADAGDPTNLTFSWNRNGSPLPNSGPSIEINPVTVDDAGIYTVTVTNANGCSSVAQVELFTEEPAPINLMGGGNYCPGIAHMLSASVGGNIMDYAWSLNGTLLPNEHSASIFFPSLDANNAGVYSLTVTSLNGCTSSAQTTINVIAPPQPVFDAVTYTVCANGCLVLRVEGVTPSDTYLWNTGQTNQAISACPQGNQTYCVTVTNVGGCTASACTNVVIAAPIQAHFTFAPAAANNCYRLNFQGSATGGQAPYTYQWAFSGALPATGSGQNVNLVSYPNVPGNYNVCMTVTDALGCTSVQCQTISVGGTCNLTSLDFCYTITPNTTNYGISVTDVQSDCNGSEVIEYSFNGGITWQAQPNRRISTPGAYTLCVRVTCTVCGQTCTKICCKDFVLEPLCNILEGTSITSINVNNSTGDVRILASSVTGASYEWDFDNNGTIDQTTLVNNVTRVYPVGTHTVCLTIRRSPTCSKTICYNFVVNQPCLLTANLVARQCTNAPNEVMFSAIGNGANIWEWNFGDGNAASGQIVNHTYASPGTYNVCLTAYSSGGCFVNVCYSVLVSPTNCMPNFAREGQDEWQEVPMEEVEATQEMPLVQPSALKVFPNPARTETKVEFEMLQDADAVILVMDFNGKVVFQQKMTLLEGQQSIIVPVNELANGLYSVSVNTGMEVLNAKLSVMK